LPLQRSGARTFLSTFLSAAALAGKADWDVAESCRCSRLAADKNVDKNVRAPAVVLRCCLGEENLFFIVLVFTFELVPRVTHGGRSVSFNKSKKIKIFF